MVAGTSRLLETSNRYHSKSTVPKTLVSENKFFQRGGGEADETNNRFAYTADVAHPASPTCAHLPSSCLPERRYIVLPQSPGSDGSIISDLSDPFAEPRLNAGVSHILDSFNCLCLGGDIVKCRRRKPKRRSISPMDNKTKVVYPIASYGGRLNSKRLIEQRRKSLPQSFFRPVPSCI